MKVINIYQNPSTYPPNQQVWTSLSVKSIAATQLSVRSNQTLTRGG